MFAIAAITYLLTLEPTASFWDCPEFISQGFKQEVGHPPGNPIFILAARFFINFASSPQTVAICVNAMSALLSAATIMLLFWTITHLVRRLVVKDDATEITWQQLAIIMGSGVAGALAYAWSDTFWFSAVEAEVYAFSSFCTALIFWLILKWENRCNQPHSDRYLIAIAYVIGVSIAVHLLNLLCIPAIVLVFYYKKFKNINTKGSLLALLASFAIIVLILYGLVPGFVEIAQYFELLFVNGLGFGFNSGVLAYTIIVAALFIWALREFYLRNSQTRMKLAFFLTVLASGMFFLGDGLLVAAILTIALGVYLFRYCKKVPVRIFNNILISIVVIFIGYSSYALILIRSNAHTPMDQNSPDNVFALADYLSREQYGKTPLLYGPVYNAPILYQQSSDGVQRPVKTYGKPIYRKEIKTTPDQPDHYRMIGRSEDLKMSPEMYMLFPRLYAGAAAKGYSDWVGGITGTPVEATTLVDADGNAISKDTRMKPTFGENLQYFLDYQLNYMYWRYFMWNFAGRQNDIAGQGEITHGNWISGIPFIDNPRLGDQSLLPDDLGKGNAGHNVFYLMPLILGIIGLLWQAYKGKRGIEQFWIVFFLFFMTGIAIVLYLNQTPSQPRERDYAYAGSFYAFAIWIGMGVAGLWKLLEVAVKKAAKKELHPEDNKNIRNALTAVAVAVGIIVPIQMVSQTWDDHDRSGRYAARDFGMNYLSSVGPNGIIFTNGDNDTFPLWYAQEVEGWRTDVRVVNLSYLATDWYIQQMRRPAYNSPALQMMAPQDAYAYDRRQFNYFIQPDTSMMVPAEKAFAEFYSDRYDKNPWGLPEFKYPMMYAAVDADAVIRNGIMPAEKRSLIESHISLNMLADKYTVSDGGMSASKTASLDIIASDIKNGWKRPIYFAMTVPDSYYDGLMPYMASTGMAYEVKPQLFEYDGVNMAVDTETSYKNITEKFRWGGLDKATPEKYPYLDETVRRMVTTTRTTMSDLAYSLLIEGLQSKALTMDAKGNKLPDTPDRREAAAYATTCFKKAITVARLIEQKLPAYASPYAPQEGEKLAKIYYFAGQELGDKAVMAHAKALTEKEIMRYAQYVRFYQSLSPSQYSLLTNTDQYIDVYYVMDLLQEYHEYASEKEVAAIVNKLENAGVNIQRLISRYPKGEGGSTPKQEAAAADSTQPATVADTTQPAE